MIINVDELTVNGFDGVCVVSMSGGKDSIRMLHLLVEKKFPVDIVLFADTGVERSELYSAIEKVRSFCYDHSIEFVCVRSSESFIDISRRKGVPNKMCRWCNTDLKVKPMQDYLRARYPRKRILNYIGICSDEVHRVHRAYNRKPDSFYCYPLVDYCVPESECMKFVVDYGYYTFDFVSRFRHSNCWLCPFMWDDELTELSAEQLTIMCTVNDYTPYKYRWGITNFLENFKNSIDK